MDTIKLIHNDPYLQPYSQVFTDLQQLTNERTLQLTQGGSLVDFASGHHYFGLHKIKRKWHLREWAPNATQIYLVGDFNNWEENEKYKLTKHDNGNWELVLNEKQLKHEDLYALHVHWNGGWGKRIPAWSQRVVQNNETKIFNAQVWSPTNKYKWKNNNFVSSNKNVFIYEAHVGMAGEEERVHTYNEFRENVLPRVKEAGYNVIQFMAIPEHPYYGSFGYHVSNFFAASSRFGTPEELKELIDTAHGMGIAVIMDLIHSHAVKNEIEGLGNYDGTRYQFFHAGTRGEHPAWDSYCFNYSKHEVLHFLLSNAKYWLEEFKFDGYRFDGVTSMLYFDHGLERAFTGYHDYFSSNLDYDAVVYFKLVNQLIHQINPNAISIAEDMSGLPGLGAPVKDGGLGFNFRMSMGVPDFWIKQIKEKQDEQWEVGDIFYQLTSHRDEEQVVSYVESHDQALVGDQTIIFRLIDKEIYYSMRKDQPNHIVERGIALHKMIRLITASCASGAYLNFMGNEFGHPEWIDFPREGNNWSYAHARRIWSISNNKELKFHWLKDFDQDLIHILKENNTISIPEIYKIWENKEDQVLFYTRGDLMFIYNFNPSQSFVDYGIKYAESSFQIILNSDSDMYGGHNRIDDSIIHQTVSSDGETHYLRVYLPARTSLVLKRIN